MWTGSEKRYCPHLDTLEDRMAPSASPTPVAATASAGSVLTGPALVGQVAPLPQGSQAQAHGDCLTMAVVTEAYPMPPGVHQPGVPSVAPFPMGPMWVFTAVVQHHH